MKYIIAVPAIGLAMTALGVAGSGCASAQEGPARPSAELAEPGPVVGPGVEGWMRRNNDARLVPSVVTVRRILNKQRPPSPPRAVTDGPLNRKLP